MLFNKFNEMGPGEINLFFAALEKLLKANKTSNAFMQYAKNDTKENAIFLTLVNLIKSEYAQLFFGIKANSDSFAHSS